MYTCMTPVGFDTSDKFENHWCSELRGRSPRRGAWASQLRRNVAAVATGETGEPVSLQNKAVPIVIYQHFLEH